MRYARCGGTLDIHLTANSPRNLNCSEKILNQLRFDRIWSWVCGCPFLAHRVPISGIAWTFGSWWLEDVYICWKVWNSCSHAADCEAIGHHSPGNVKCTNIFPDSSCHSYPCCVAHFKLPARSWAAKPPVVVLSNNGTDTIRDAILTRARKPTRVGLIYRRDRQNDGQT